MYLNSIEITNIGPITQLNLKLEALNDRAPFPLVFVGANGSGKSLILAQIASALINAQSSAFEDADIEKGYVFKIMSSSYISRGKNYMSFSELQFSDGFSEEEIVSYRRENNLREYYSLPDKAAEAFRRLDLKHNSQLKNNFSSDPDKTRKAMTGPHIYFPPNRFEDPAWINDQYLRNKIDFFSIKKYVNHSNLKVIEHSPMKENQTWLLDLLFYSFLVEKRSSNCLATIMLTKIQEIICLLLGETGPVSWSIGRRSSRTIEISANGKILISNLFALSTGQSMILDLFLTILRHADLSMPQMKTLDEIEGMVVIDEIDLHLHTDLQYSILPKLISMFPRVQFIISSHSPLFLLGMEKEFGESGSTIIDLPSGLQITAERFTEFKSAYDRFTRTREFEETVARKIKETLKPLLFVEGKTDVDYIIRAAEILEKIELLSKLEILAGDGYGGLNRIWKNFYCDQWTNINQIVILLYDCDVRDKNNDIGNTFRRSIPAQESVIMKGIENLLPHSTIERAKKYKIAFFDYEQETNNLVRGKNVINPEKWSVNQDEKRNLCNYICENGDHEDFKHFNEIFKIIDDCMGN